MPRARPPRVLLVDDDANFRELLALLLRADLGAEVVGHAGNGSLGVALAREHRPDLVVMDLGMPTMDGFEATRQVVNELPETRVVVVSSSTEPDDVERATACGAAAYLSKDRAVSELVATLQGLRAPRRAAVRRPLRLFLARRLVLG